MRGLYAQEALIAAAVAVGFLAAARRERRSGFLKQIPLPAVGFLCASVMSLAAAVDPTAGLREVAQYAAYMLLFIAVFSAGRSLMLTVLLGTMAAICAAVVLAGTWQLARGWVYPISFFGNRNAFAGLAAGLLPLSAAWSEARLGRFGRPAVLALFFAAFLVLPAAGWVGTAAGLAVLFCAKKTRGLAALAFCAGILGIAAAALFAPDHFARQLANLGLHDPNGTDISQRYLEWVASLNMLSDNPVFGVGAGNYQARIGEYFGVLPKFDTLEYDAQNGWLVMAATTGLAGLFMLGGLFAGGIKASWQRFAKETDIETGALLAGIVAWIAVDFFTVIWVRETGPFVMIALALLWSRAAPDGPADNGEAGAPAREITGAGMFATIAAAMILAVVSGAHLRVREPFHLMFEAEEMSDITPPMAVADDRLASGFRALEIPFGAGKGFWNEAGGSAEKLVSLPRDDSYFMWFRSRWEGNCENAVFLQIDQSRRFVVGNDAIFNAWHWVKAGPFKLAAGPRKLRLSNHSHGIRIDKVEITNDPRYEPAGYGREVSVFFDGFGGCDGQDYGSWTFLAGDWSIVGSSIANPRGTSATLAQTSGAEAMAVAHQLKWRDCDFETYVMSAGRGKVGLVFAYEDRRNYRLVEWENARSCPSNAITLSAVSGGRKQTVAKGGRGYRNDAWEVLGVRCKDGEVTVRADAVEALRVSGLRAAEGLIGLYAADNDCTYFDNVKVVKLIGGKPADEPLPAAAAAVDRREEEIDGARLVVERVTIGQERVPAFLIYEKARAGKWGPAIIELHAWGECKSVKGRRLAPRPALRGYVEVHIDLWGHGERAAPDLLSRAKDNFPRLGMDILKNTAHDINAVMDYLESRKDLGIAKTGVAGYSMGGGVAVLAMMLDRRIAAAAAVNSGVCDYGASGSNQVYGALQGWRTDIDRQLDPGLRADYLKYDPLLHPENFQHRPLLLMCNRNDKIAGCDSSLRLAAKLAALYGADSNRVELVVNEEPRETAEPMASHMPDIAALAQVDRFLDRYLLETGQGSSR